MTLAYTTPLHRSPCVAGVVLTKLLTGAQCQQIIDACATVEWWEGEISQVETDMASASAEVASSALRRVRQIPANKVIPDLLLSRIAEAVTAINSAHFQFDLSGVLEQDPIMILRYDGDRADHHSLHMDIGETNPNRKLSFIVPLSEEKSYLGASLEFKPSIGEETSTRTRGVLIVFPSFRAHLVRPITSGSRFALVGWLHGPSFR